MSTTSLPVTESDGQPSDAARQAWDRLSNKLLEHERLVLVGTRYTSIRNSWAEWDKTFDEVVGEMSARWEERAPRQSADEIIEVIVVRRARISSEVSVEEVPVAGREADSR